MSKSHLKTVGTVITQTVSEETGEIVDINTKHHKILTKNKEHFLLVYSSLLSAFIEMSMPEIRVYGYLLRYAEGISFSVTKPLREQMSKELGINERTIYNTINELDTKKLLFKQDGLYRINPRYAFRGSSHDRDSALKVVIELGCKDC